MKRIVKKIHHFTKRELATEEIVIIIIVTCALAAAALAASAILPIRAAIVQCGSRDELPAKCREDQRCCTLLEMSAYRESRSKVDETIKNNATDTSGTNNTDTPGMEDIDVEKGAGADIE